MSRALTPPPPACWQPLLELALREDIGPGDLTSELTIPSEARGAARIEAREALTVCGLFLVEAVFGRVDPSLDVTPLCQEGDHVGAGTTLARIEGRLRGILTAERTALNFLGHLSGVATATRRCVQEVEGTATAIVDTRKTLPGWRALEKFAVRAGGGVNHRFALYDGILLKDNHIAANRGIRQALARTRRSAPTGLRVQVEVESEQQAEQAIAAGADFLLLDNRTPEQVRSLVERFGDRALLEASGGIRRENLRQYAETGVARIALGAITHSAPSADVALELIEAPDADA